MNGWEKYQELVLTKISDLSSDHKEMKKELAALRAEISHDFNKISGEIIMLKTKAALWGSIAGSAISILIQYLIGGRK